MSELRIIRGKDIVLFLDDEPLFGVTEFSATEKRVYHQVRECMRSAAVKHVPQEAHYQLKVKALNVFDGQIPEDELFTLSVRFEDEEYVYENCRLTECVYGAKGAENAESIYTLEADSMRWQEVEDE